MIGEGDARSAAHEMPCVCGMRSSHILAALTVLLVAAPAARASDATFEGRIQLRLRDADPQGVDYALRDGRARVDVPSIGGAHDLHFVVNLARDAGARPAGVRLLETGQVRAVVGQTCEDWRIVDGDDFVDVCVVRGAGWYDPRRLVGGTVPEWSRVLEIERAFPLSVTEVRDGRDAFAMWATGVEREPVSEDLFKLPQRTARRMR